MLIGELKHAGFKVQTIEKDWPGGDAAHPMYCVVFLQTLKRTVTPGAMWAAKRDCCVQGVTTSREKIDCRVKHHRPQSLVQMRPWAAVRAIGCELMKVAAVRPHNKNLVLT